MKMNNQVMSGRGRAGIAALLLFAGWMAQASDGTKRWSREWGSSTSDLAYAVAVDGASNVTVAGGAYGGFDGQSNEGSRDVFLSRFLPNGTRQLSAMWGSVYDDYASGVAVDAAGYIYLAGGTYGEFDGENNAGKNDAFLTKCAPDGTRVWTRIWGTATNDSAYDVAVDSATNIYVSGFTHGDLEGQTVTGARDAFVTKFTPDGSRQWSRLLGSSGNDNAYAVAVDGGGNVYVTGSYNESGGTESDAFLAKYTATGVSVWNQVWGSASYDESRGVEIDAASNLFVAGFTDGSLDGQTSSGLRDAFFSAYSIDGVRLWTRQWGSASNDSAYDIALDRAGYIYVSGNTDGAFDGQTVAGKQDVFVSQYSPVGDRIWSRIVGSVSNDYAQGMTCGADSNVY
ncbi:MAG: SBBP repeat-containing protein, partial [Lentisphaerae bacterium]|nr:SBBP repeat-containing protein [Lentisphaerota bacterium]